MSQRWTRLPNPEEAEEEESSAHLDKADALVVGSVPGTVMGAGEVSDYSQEEEAGLGQ